MQENVAVVTGGTGGLGRALIPFLVRRDFKVAVTYLIPEEARELEDELGLDEDRLMLRRCDCTDAAAARCDAGSCVACESSTECAGVSAGEVCEAGTCTNSW